MKRSSVRLSVRLPVPSIDGEFAAERPVSRYRSIASGAGAAYQLQVRCAAGAGAQQQIRAVSC